MLKIGEFSTLAKTTIKTLRFYDEINLFKPEFVDENGYRYYTIEQLNILQRIVELRKLEMPIRQIQEILTSGNAVLILKKRLKELENKLAIDKRNIALVKNYLAKAKKGDFMNKYEAKEIILPKCVVYYRHGVIPTMNDLVPFILGAGEEVRANNPTLKCAEPEYCFVCYGSNEYKEKDVELEYAEAVVAVGNESENIKFRQLDEEKAISVMHKGPYSELGKAYVFAVNYVKEAGYEIANPIRERYINGCWDTEDENNYLTEIQIPIK